MQVEHVDFVSVLTQDLQRARRFYVETLGLEVETEGDSDMELRCGQVTLDIFDPSSIGQPFAPSPAGISLRVADVDAARAELESKGVVFDGDTIVTGVCKQAWFKDPDGNALMLHRRFDAMTRTDLLERYRALPLPTTKDESWRFTDLKGFDPETFSANGATEVAAAPGLLELEAAGVVRVSESGLEIDRAPDGIRFEPLADHPLLGELVGSDEKFAAHNAAEWKHGLLVHVPKDVVLEQPLMIRIVNSVDGGSLFWRLLIVADPGSRFSVIEEYASTTPELSGYLNAAVEIFVADGARVEYVSVQNVSQETWHFGTHHARVERDAELDWVAAGFGSKKGKIRIQNDLAGQGATSRVTGAYFADGNQHLDYDTFQEHIAPEHDERLRVQGRAPRRVELRLARDDPRRGGRAEDERLPGEPESPPLQEGARRLDPRPRDPRERRALHARCDARAGRSRAALLPDGPRPLARRGRADDRARLLPGRARPDRARAGARSARRRARSPHPAGVAPGGSARSPASPSIRSTPPSARTRFPSSPALARRSRSSTRRSSISGW